MTKDSCCHGVRLILMYSACITISTVQFEEEAVRSAEIKHPKPVRLVFVVGHDPNPYVMYSPILV